MKAKELYRSRKKEIENRLAEFRRVWKTGSEKDILAELVFCLLTPQSKARVCWDTVKILIDKDLLVKGKERTLADIFYRVRFKNKKSRYVCEARRCFFDNGILSVRSKLDQFDTPAEKREWLVTNIKGMGYKEASHFLRNVGLGNKLAILDRHILKNLKVLGVIKEIPKTLTKKKYLSIEEKMIKYSRQIKIPLDHLDLLFWCSETGEVFK